MDREARAPALLVTDQFPVACLMSCILNDLVHKKTTVAVGNRKTAQKAESMGLRCLGAGLARDRYPGPTS